MSIATARMKADSCADMWGPLHDLLVGAAGLYVKPSASPVASRACSSVSPEHSAGRDLRASLFDSRGPEFVFTMEDLRKVVLPGARIRVLDSKARHMNA